MEKQIKLEGTLRTAQEKLAPEYMPAVCYGKDTETLVFSLRRNDFIKVLSEAGESHLISLKVEGKEVKVLIKDVQRDAVKNFPIHADFYQVNMKEEVHAETTLEFVGESKAIKEQGGILVKPMDTVSIVCLPDDLVDKITIDISDLDNLEDKITLADLKLPKGVKLDYETLDTVVAMIAAPKKQEEEEIAAPAEGEAKKEGEEKKEGEAEKK